MQKVKLSDIRPNPNNPRVIKDDKFKKLVKSIQDFPQMLELRPIVVNDEMIVLGGNMRLKALEHLGIEETFIIKAGDLTDKQEQEFIIKDNVGYGEWDWDQLANEWDVEDLDEWGLDLPLDFVKELEAEEDDFAIPEGGIETDIVLGDLFEIVSHPMTHSYFMNDASVLWETINTLKSNYDMMAWGTKTCGLHVHISRAGFSGGSHQHRFLQLVYNNKDFYEVLAGRSRIAT